MEIKFSTAASMLARSYCRNNMTEYQTIYFLYVHTLAHEIHARINFAII